MNWRNAWQALTAPSQLEMDALREQAAETLIALHELVRKVEADLGRQAMPEEVRALLDHSWDPPHPRTLLDVALELIRQP